MSGFDYFGEHLEYAPEFPRFEYAEFCEAMADDVEATGMHATGVALRLAVACVAESDRTRFRALSRKNRAAAEDWLRVFRDWSEEETERPTGQPADSSDGLSETVGNSGSQPVASVTSIVEPKPELRADLALAASRSRSA